MATWTYDDPTTTSRDQLRLLIGDTDEDDQLLSDNEVSYFLTEHGSVVRAAPEAARAVAAKFARLMNRNIGGLQADFAAKFRHYLQLSQELEGLADDEPVGPWLSGYSKSAKQVREQDTDRELVFGRKGVHDNPRSPTGDDSDYTEQYRVL